MTASGGADGVCATVREESKTNAGASKKLTMYLEEMLGQGSTRLLLPVGREQANANGARYFAAVGSG